MLKNYLTLALRNLLKRKLYSFINIFGLATGVAVCLVILKYVDFQLSYDDFHVKADRIFRTVTSNYRNGEFTGSNPLSGSAQVPAMQADIPEIKSYVRTHPMYGGAVVSNQDKSDLTFQEENMQFADSTFFDIFTYEASSGNLNTALDDPNSIVITEKVALKYFGTTDVIGKSLVISGGWTPGTYSVSAVLKSVPENTHFTFDFVMPIHNLLRNDQYKNDDGWGWQNFVSYIELHPNTDVHVVEAKLPAFITKYQGEDLARSGSSQVLKLQPIRDIHLSPGLELESSPTMSMNTIYFFIVISIFILAIAWVNYINLSTARAMERAREVGIKKSIGAFRKQLIGQFLLESFVVNFIAVALAVLIAVLLLPVLGEIVDKDFRFDFGDIRLWYVIGILFLFGSVVSGIYPAFVLSSFKTSTVLKGSVEKMSGGFTLRKALVVFQFVSSLILIAGTFAIYRQISFMRSQDKGFTMERMFILKGPSVFQGEGVKDRLISFKEKLKNESFVKSVATSTSIPGGGFNWGTTMRKDGAALEENKSGNVTWIDPDFLNTYGLTLIAGRNWNPDSQTDMQSVIANEAALTTFGLGTPEQALNERIVLGGDTVDIIGVLKNYHWNSLKTSHEPILLAATPIARKNYSILLGGTDMPSAVRKIEEMYKEAFPGNPFDFYFLDDFFDRQYTEDQQFARIFGWFAALAIVIACLGLFGLASFTTTQKLREISIRKVLGASTSSIMTLLSSQFMKLVGIASVIAVPVIWYGLDQWLDNFAFRISIGWELFVVPAVILGLIALTTVSIQIVKGANTNPAKILRSE